MRRGARVLGAAVELHYLSAPLEVLFDRVKSRGMENPPISREELSQWQQLFQAPTAEEMALYDQPLISDLELRPGSV